MAVGSLIFFEFLTAESHLFHSLTVISENDRDGSVGYGGDTGIRIEPGFDNLIDSVADTP